MIEGKGLNKHKFKGCEIRKEVVVLKVMWKLRVDTDLRGYMSALWLVEFMEGKKTTFLSERERETIHIRQGEYKVSGAIRSPRETSE